MDLPPNGASKDPTPQHTSPPPLLPIMEDGRHAKPALESLQADMQNKVGTK